MKFIHLRDFDDVTSALNFDAPDCRVVGGCDLYTTKAAGVDKKLYKNIDKSLESQYESLLRLSASLSPPHGTSESPSVNLSRSSPFGPLSQISSRRTFAYLIATLNASHPDYDFSNILRPADFRRERSLKGVINRIDSTLYNLRPRPAATSLAVSTHWSAAAQVKPSPNPSARQTWGPRMWRMMDKEMDLQHCTIYHYAPDEDPYDGDDGAIWSENYFFFNKMKKRVCYLYFRGLSVISHSPAVRRLSATLAKEVAKNAQNITRSSASAIPLTKRVRNEEFGGGWDSDDDDYDLEMSFLSDDDVDVEVLDDSDEAVFVNFEDYNDTSLSPKNGAIQGIGEDMIEVKV